MRDYKARVKQVRIVDKVAGRAEKVRMSAVGLKSTKRLRCQRALNVQKRERVLFVSPKHLMIA